MQIVLIFVTIEFLQSQVCGTELDSSLETIA